MKKKLLLLVLILIISGCAIKKEKENENANVLIEEIEKQGIMENIEGLNEALLLSEFGIREDLVDDYMSAKSEITSDIYIAIKPKNDKKEIVKSALDNYFNNKEMLATEYEEENVNEDNPERKIKETDEYLKVKNRLEEEYNGYYIYIMTNSNEEVLNIIKKNIDN